MKKKLVVGNFDVEFFWRDENLCKLPFINIASQTKSLSLMDELLFLLCDKGDTLITKKAFNQPLYDYLSSLDFFFNHNTNDIICDDELSKNINIFYILMNKIHDLKFKEKLTVYNIESFGVQEFSDIFCEKMHIEYDNPHLETIKSVNSKEYSFLLREKVGLPLHGIVVNSTEMFNKKAIYMLDKYGALLVKDFFGVSGKGNIYIDTIGLIERITMYISRQEKQGKYVKFILEPFFNKKNDFTCLANIEKNGTSKIIDTQFMMADGFMYSGTQELSIDMKKFIFDSNYADIVNKVCKNLYQDGYYGDVCIDSMILQNNEIFPLVEINARKSMTYLKHCLDKKVNQWGGKCSLTYDKVFLSEHIDMQEFLDFLKNHNILFSYANLQGIIPLTANSLSFTRQDPIASKFYYAVVAKTIEEIEIVSLKVRTIFKDNRLFR